MVLFSASAIASNQSIVYQGRILRPDGTVLNSGSLTFTLALYSPAPKKCLLYSETQTLNMTGSSGMFSLALGSGNRSDGGAHAFNQVFVNGGALSSLTCADGSTSYSPAGTDDRSLVASFNDNGTVVTLSAMEIKSIPFALQAHQIGGYGINDIIKVHPTTGSATTFTTAELGKVRAIGAATCANNEILKWNGSTWACAPDATGGSPSDASYSAKGILQFDTDAATSGVSVTSGVAKLSDVLSTPGTFGSATKNVTLTVNAQGRITAAAHQDIEIPASQITASGANNGEVLKWNGTAWAPAADAGTTTDASYAAKGIVQFDTNAATSGITAASGVAKVNFGTGANQIVKLDASARLPAVDGSQLTNLPASSFTGTLGVANGGTGATTLTSNGVLLGNGTSAVSATAAGTAHQVLRVPSGGGAPVFGAIDIAQSAAVTGTLPPGSGGTGQSSYTAGDLLYASGASATSKLGIGANGTVLTSTGSAPQWSSIDSLGFFVNGGNTFTGTATLGSNSNHNLEFETNGATRMTILADGKIGIGTTAPTHSLTLPSTSTGVSLYNTADQTTNVERLSIKWNSNQATIGTEWAGGGSSRSLVLQTANSNLLLNGSTTGGLYQFSSGNALSGVDGAVFSGTWSGSSAAANNIVKIAPTISQSGTASYTALLINPTESTIGSGARYLFDAQIGGTTRFNVTPGGAVGIGNAYPIAPLDIKGYWRLRPTQRVLPVIVNDAVDIGTFNFNFGTGLVKVNVRVADNNFVSIKHFVIPVTYQQTGGQWAKVLPLSNTGIYSGNDYELDARSTGNLLDLRLRRTAGSDAGTADIVLEEQAGPYDTLTESWNAYSVTAPTILYGNTSLTQVNGNTGVGLLAPKSSLHVAGGIQLGPDTATCDATKAGTFRYTAGNVMEFCNSTAWTALAASGTFADSSHSTKGIVQFDTNTATSGVVVTSGVAKVNFGTGANQLVQLNGSSQLPALDGSLLSNLSAANITAGTLPVGRGGTGLTAGTSGGIPYYSATNTMASSALLTQNGVVLGGGAGAAPATTAAGAADTVLRVPSGGGAPAFGSIDLSKSAAVTGTLAIGNGGTGRTAFDVDRLVGTNGAGALVPVTCSQGQVLSFDVSGVYGCYNVGSIFNGFVDGGNTFTATATLGTNSNHNLEIETNGTTKMTVLADGKVGIGTTTPSGTLHLWGPGTNGSESTLYFGDQDNSTNPLIRERLPGDTDQLDISAREGLFFRTNGSDRVTIDKNGNVGIGTTSPGAKLQIYSSSTIPETWKQIQVINMSNSGSSATYNALIGLDFSGTNSVTGAGTTESFATTTTLSSTSDAKMQMITGHMVDLTTHASDAGWGLLVRNQYQGNSTGGTQYGVVLQMGDTDVTNYGIHQSGANVVNYFQGKVGVGNASPAASALVDIDSTTKGFLIPRMTETQRDAIASPALGLQVYNTTTNLLNFYNGTAWTVLSTGGGSYLSSSGGTLSGNLAMGTNNITSIGGITGNGALTVAAGGSNQNLTLSSTGTGSVNATTGNGTQFSILNGPASTVNYVTVQGAAAGGSPVIGTAGSDTNINLTLTPKGTGNTIFSSGKVGIGDSSPAQTLQVSGSIGATGAISSTNAAGIYLYDNGTSGIVGAFANSSGARPMLMMGQTLAFYTGSPGYTAKMSLDAAGKLGIGASSPSANLEVRSTGNNTVSGNGIRVTASDYATNGGYLTINKASGTGSVGSIQVGDTANYGPLILNASGGFVGVGTTTPDSKLDVYNVETRTTASKFAALEGGISVEPTASLAGGAHRSAIFGQAIVPDTVSNAVRNINGVDGLASYLASGGAGSVIGGNFYSYNGGSGTTSNIIGVYGGADASGTGTVSNLVGVNAESYTYSGTVTNQYGVGIYMENNGGAVANRYGIYLHTPLGTATNDYGIYQEPDKNNYFKGNVGINDATPETKLKVQGTLKVEAGQIYVAEQTSSAASPLTFNTDSGNAMLWTTNTVSPTVNVHNLKAGGAYTLTVRGTGTGTVTINCYSDAGTTALTSSFVPANGARTTGTANITVYNILRTGNYCLVTWISGF